MCRSDQAQGFDILLTILEMYLHFQDRNDERRKCKEVTEASYQLVELSWATGRILLSLTLYNVIPMDI